MKIKVNIKRVVPHSVEEYPIVLITRAEIEELAIEKARSLYSRIEGTRWSVSDIVIELEGIK